MKLNPLNVDVYVLLPGEVPVYHVGREHLVWRPRLGWYPAQLYQPGKERETRNYVELSGLKVGRVARWLRKRSALLPLGSSGTLTVFVRDTYGGDYLGVGLWYDDARNLCLSRSRGLAPKWQNLLRLSAPKVAETTTGANPAT